MARGVSITPNGGAAVLLTPRPGSMKIGFDNADTGGDGVPNVRNANPMKVEFDVVADSSAPTVETLLGLRNSTTKPADHAAEVETLAGDSYSLTDVLCQVSLEGEGVQIAKFVLTGNVSA